MRDRAAQPMRAHMTPPAPAVMKAENQAIFWHTRGTMAKPSTPPVCGMGRALGVGRRVRAPETHGL